jgi:hypothetical protein
MLEGSLEILKRLEGLLPDPLASAGRLRILL